MGISKKRKRSVELLFHQVGPSSLYLNVWEPISYTDLPQSPPKLVPFRRNYSNVRNLGGDVYVFVSSFMQLLKPPRHMLFWQTCTISGVSENNPRK